MPVWKINFCSMFLRYYSPIHSDEGLTLETLLFESFTMANLPYRPCGCFSNRVDAFHNGDFLSLGGRHNFVEQQYL